MLNPSLSGLTCYKKADTSHYREENWIMKRLEFYAPPFFIVGLRKWGSESWARDLATRKHHGPQRSHWCPTYKESRLPSTTEASHILLQTPESNLQLKTSEMHHPAASRIGSGSVIQDVADIPQPIRIPFSCNGGAHSWNCRAGRSTRRIDYTLLKPCFKTIKGFLPVNPEMWKQRSI